MGHISSQSVEACFLSLSGLLYQKKGYMKLVLNPKSIRLRDVRNKYMSRTIFFYEFIWDTPTADPMIETIQSELNAHIPRLSFKVVMTSLKTQTVASQRGPRTISHKYRHSAEVEVTRVNSAK